MRHLWLLHCHDSCSWLPPLPPHLALLAAIATGNAAPQPATATGAATTGAAIATAAAAAATLAAATASAAAAARREPLLQL